MIVKNLVAKSFINNKLTKHAFALRSIKFLSLTFFCIKTERDKYRSKGLLQISSKAVHEHNRQVTTIYNHCNKEAYQRKMEGSTIKSKTQN